MASHLIKHCGCAHATPWWRRAVLGLPPIRAATVRTLSAGFSGIPHCTPTTKAVRRLDAVHSCRRHTSTLSPLAAAFNAKRNFKLDFKKHLLQSHAGLFLIPELNDRQGFYLLQEQAEIKTNQLIAEATDPNRKRKIVSVFDELSDVLCRVADMADFVRVAHPDQSFAGAAEDACMSVSALVEKLNTNQDIHRALSQVTQNGDHVPTDEIDRRVAELFMFDFEQSGIHLPAYKRDKFVQLNENIMTLGTYFMQGTGKNISVSRDALPEGISQWFSVSGDTVHVTGQFAENHSDTVREVAYKLYLYPDVQQLDLLSGLLRNRDELAKLVGFPTYAHRTLRGTLGTSPETVNTFLETLADRIRPHAEANFEDIKKVKWQNGTKTDVMPWDPPYYSSLARHQRCAVDNSVISPYLSLGSCMQGLGQLFTALYGVTLQHEETQNGELWHPDVYKLAVNHETEGTLGYIYCDFFERRGKPSQDCHYTIQGGRLTEDGTYQQPIVVLQLNLPCPSYSTPSLLTPCMMENLFHEFGHAMHSMLGRTRYQHVTGTRCPTDFAEVPSILMEYFCMDPRVLSTFAHHWQTGEPLSQSRIQDLCRAKKMFAASELQQQVFYAILDQRFHGEHPLQGSTTDILRDVQNTYYGLPHVPGTAYHLRFGHFVGYGAKYYSYMLSRAVAARIWNKCFKHDPFSRANGERYRAEVLAHGGGRPPMDLIQDILGEQPSMADLVQSILDDIVEE